MKPSARFFVITFVALFNLCMNLTSTPSFGMKGSNRNGLSRRVLWRRSCGRGFEDQKQFHSPSTGLSKARMRAIYMVDRLTVKLVAIGRNRNEKSLSATLSPLFDNPKFFCLNGGKICP